MIDGRPVLATIHAPVHSLTRPDKPGRSSDCQRPNGGVFHTPASHPPRFSSISADIDTVVGSPGEQLTALVYDQRSDEIFWQAVTRMGQLRLRNPQPFGCALRLAINPHAGRAGIHHAFGVYHQGANQKIAESLIFGLPRVALVLRSEHSGSRPGIERSLMMHQHMRFQPIEAGIGRHPGLSTVPASKHTALQCSGIKGLVGRDHDDVDKEVG